MFLLQCQLKQEYIYKAAKLTNLEIFNFYNNNSIKIY